ncbi:hypothetical protein CRP01_17585 [Flavilitoribacter nigricans DSM 23189 = NBRC 102662]|uniref:Uncharacterized protein n=1 Tax=Flavilitoribacter nigricans (strain ATCC 23147 / DSM 23189 / NBRC 102662 / NCIMB 1420 / SS-2) TaxID=1122177 RepID=A0A2D0NAB4_FLAN2|nr:hypothetical protein CRP01_17585 [Flavilitoribacter nigricans DSM 23189 = NBRC 102662]
MLIDFIYIKINIISLIYCDFSVIFVIGYRKNLKKSIPIGCAPGLVCYNNMVLMFIMKEASLRIWTRKDALFMANF